MGRRPLGSFLVMLVAASVLTALPLPRHAVAAVAEKKFELLRDALDQVRAKYVVKPDDSKLLEDAIKGVLTGLETRGGLVPSPSPRHAVAADADKTFELFEAVLRQVRAKYAVKSDELETPRRRT